MNLIPWRNKRSGNELQESPRALDIHRFRHEIDRMFDRFFQDPFGAFLEPSTAWGGWAPSLDIVETDHDITLKVDVPGVDPKDLDIRISGNVLTLSGEKSESNENQGDTWYHSERRFGTFRRNVQLPSYVDPEKVSAEHANGVLTIRLEKLKSATPKRVPVKVTAS